MALRDVKEYYYKILAQKIEMQQNLKDYEQAFKDGYVTEDQLKEVKEDVAKIITNTDRIAYIIYRFELPKRKEKQSKYIKANKVLQDYFNDCGASEEAVFTENESALTHLRIELKKIKEKQ